MKTLLQIAKETKPTRRTSKITEQQLEVALAWARDEINYKQANAALDTRYGMNTYTHLALALREYFRRNGK